MRRRAAVSTCLLMAGALVACSVRSGEILGPVVDIGGKPVAARVSARCGPDGIARETATNRHGWYFLADLPAGHCVVRAESAGHAAASVTIDLPRGVRFTQGFQLLSAQTTAPPPPPPAAVRVGGRIRPPDLALALGVEGGVPGGVVGGVLGRRAAIVAPLEMTDRYAGPMETEDYARTDDEGFRDPRRDPLSTFSVDVDTASYANSRRFLNEGRLPPPDAVRLEEFVNAFAYDDEPPAAGDGPFAVRAEVGPCPWRPDHRLVRIALQGRVVPEADLPPLNLVFLVDVSGSMNEPRKLPLLKAALRLLAARLRPSDHVAIVVYAGSSGLVLPRTAGDRKREILAALDSLEAGGSTNGGEGIELAYRVAAEGARQGETSRVVLATDGDFNVGVTSRGALTRLIEEKRKTGVFLSVLGFGEGNLKDSAMEPLADRGNGNYSYVDSLQEARKVLVREAGGTLVTIAKDVKVQVEMNPARVQAYRLLGYTNRRLRAEDFRDDRVDAGEIGAGHHVTALYEIVPTGAAAGPPVDPLRYQSAGPLPPAARSGELMTVKVRYKEPEGQESRELAAPVPDAERPGGPSRDFTFATAVAEFALLLRDSNTAGTSGFAGVSRRARVSLGADPSGDRAELARLVDLAATLAEPPRAASGR